MPFESTMWTMIGRAKAGSQQDLETLLRRYRPPLLAYLRGCKLSDADAEDVLQEVLLAITQDDFLSRADREKGRFRNLLLRVARNLLASEFRKRYSAKRGGQWSPVSLDTLAELPAPEEERFAGLWVRNLIRIGLDRMQQESARWKVPYHEVLVRKYLQDLSYEEIAAQIGCTPKDVDNYCYHGRKLLRHHLEELVQEYSSTDGECADEIELLQRYLG